MNIRSGTATHSGLKRTHNEDASLADDARGIYAVADGMGGHAAGEVASTTAIATLQHYAALLLRPSEEVFAQVFHSIHQQLLTAGESYAYRGMGTTLTAAVVVGDMLHVAHAGDSACFLLRADWAKQITDKHGSQHVLFNCLGAKLNAFLGAQYVPIKIVPGDMIILATDGLADYLPSAEELTTLVRRAASFEQVPGTLVQHALDSGGRDNVTVVAVGVWP